MVVVIEFINEGDFVVLRDVAEGEWARRGFFRIHTASPLVEVVAVGAEAHCAAEGVAGFEVFPGD